MTSPNLQREDRVEELTRDDDAEWLRELAAGRQDITAEAELRLERIADRIRSPEAVTDEMIEAGLKALQEHLCQTGATFPGAGALGAIYKAMGGAALLKVSP